MTPKLFFTRLCLFICFTVAVMCVDLSKKPTEEEKCYALNKNPYLNFGPSTSYYNARRKEGFAKPQGCVASQLWMITRHGTRYPDEEDYESFDELNSLAGQILANHRQHKRGSLCKDDLDNLENYKFDLPKTKATDMTESGKRELYDLGMHVYGAFPEIFTDRTYAKNKFKFLHTPLKRTKESAEYFYMGLFGLDFDSKVIPQFEENRDLIHTYAKCSPWEQYGRQIQVLRKKFREGEEIKKVELSVRTRLGFEEPLRGGKILDMFNACRLSVAFNSGKPSPWCAVFNEDELKLLEYSVDAYYYRKTGPGCDMNKKLSCPAVKDLMDTFSRRVASPNSPQQLGSFYFTHHTMIDFLNVGLDVSRDNVALTFENYEVQKQRQYRTSKRMPYAANILAVLYQCSFNRYRMIFYQNEHTVEYPECNQNGECDFNTIQKKFNSFINDPACTDLSWCRKTSVVTKMLTEGNSNKNVKSYLKSWPGVAVIGTITVSLLGGAGWLVMTKVM